MTWQYDAHHHCFTASLDGWRLLVQQTRSKRTWRAAVVPPLGTPARIAPTVLSSRTAAQAWCLAVSRQERGEGAMGS